MRIVSGYFRGMQISTPKGTNTRPTTGKVRTAVLNSLAAEIEGAIFIDLFSGSGAMGIEALSRGARGCIFVENDRQALRALEKNLEEVDSRAKKSELSFSPLRILNDNVSTCWRKLTRTPATVVWADPPYEEAEYWFKIFAQHIASISAPDALFIWELPKKTAKRLPLASCTTWQKIRERSYGDISVISWRLNATAEPNAAGEEDDHEE